jgi:hypothetical protein
MEIRRAMDPTISTAPVIQTFPVPYLWALFTIIVAIGIYVAIENVSDLSKIQANWSEYRCQPQIMPIAGLFGYDANENFQFCLQQIIQESTKGVTGPFAQGMGGFTSVLMNLMESANSFRTMLATLVGGIIKIVSEFKSRMTSLMSRIKITAGRMRAMMFRIYGTMFAVIYMGISAQTGIANFGDTFIFKFIDTFCFPPEQFVQLDDGSEVRIMDIEVGDKLVGQSTVESIYRFAADGQSMVRLGSVTVSSNHFIRHNGKWIMAKDHPNAVEAEDWSGGIERPLVCLTTSNHRIVIDGFVFADYDETEEGNAVTQDWVNSSLNGTPLRRSTPHPDSSYDVGSPSHTKVLTVNGYVALKDIKLGDMITAKSKVVGIQTSSAATFCKLHGGQDVATGSLIWSPLKGEWVRAYSQYSINQLTPVETIALFVSPGAQYELEGGHIVRDAMEIYSPDTKKAYAEALTKAHLD